MYPETFFVNSLEVEFELCNLRCKYCWLTTGNFETFRKGDKLYSKENKAPLRFDYTVQNLVDNIGKILGRTKAHMLKVSGGEIFLLPEVIQEFNRRKHDYTKIVIVSNGLKINELFLQSLDNTKFAFQISLDGHTDEANMLRYPAATAYTKKILNNIHLMTRSGFTVEISCVLTDHNVPFLKDFALYMDKYHPGITIVPFPVRFSDYILSGNERNFNYLTDAWNAVPMGVLPPDGYKRALQEMINGSKANSCYLPIISAPICEDGSMPLCPCGIIGSRGNVFDMAEVHPLKLDDYRVQEVIDKKITKCSSCFTHFDIMNLYMEDKITFDEMLTCGIYRDRELVSKLDDYKKSIMFYAD